MRTLVKFAVAVFIFSVAKPAATQAQILGFSFSKKKDKVVIPIEIHNNLVVVPVVLNGVLPLKFILDTGVRTAILTQKSFSDILNLAYTRKYSVTGPGGEKVVDAYVTNNVSIDLPGISGKGHALLVLEEDYLELRNYLGTDVHGILGYELFSRFIVEIDYEGRKLTLYSPQGFRHRRTFRTLAIEIEDTKPYVTVPLQLSNGTTIAARLLVDSGASHALLLDPISDKRITVPANAVSSIIGRGLGGEIMGKAGRISSLTLAGFKVPRVITNFPDPNSYLDTATVKTFRNGTIGGELLSRFTVVFNFPAEKIYLRKNKSFRKDFYYNLSGLTVKSKGPKLNIFEITEVKKNSGADVQGIMKDDLIYSINGIKAETLGLAQLLALLNEKPGKRVRMEVIRQGQILRKAFILSDQI